MHILADIYKHLNKLNLLLHGQQKLLGNLYVAVNGHTGIPCLLYSTPREWTLSEFLLTGELCSEDKDCSEQAKHVSVGVLESLQKGINERFVDFASGDDVCCMFPSPHTAQPYVCQTMSQIFAVDEAVLQENSIDFKVVPGLKE